MRARPVVPREQANQDIDDAVTHDLNLPGLRAWPLTRYPYLVFYVERSDHVDVWRVLHAQRDIPAWMQEPGDA